MSEHTHNPVMLRECLEQLQVKPDGCYVDCTFGRGGHTQAILECLGPHGRLFALDRDPSAIAYGQETLNDSRLKLVQARFSQLEKIASAEAIKGAVDGILIDLGVSSPQLDNAERGFSFQHDGPLDMRMDPSTGQSAADWLATAREDSIATVLREFGEERHAKRIARFIVEDRETEAITTTVQLADLARRAIPYANRQRIHPATRTFQALRIAVNEELKEVSEVLQQALAVMRIGARLVVIAFHSLEDRIVKRFFRDVCKPHDDESGTTKKFNLPFRKPLRPDESEQQNNPRARSARLRVIERLV